MALLNVDYASDLVPQSITGQIDSETTATLMHSAALLEKLGHHVEELQLPFALSFVEDFSEYWGMLSFLSEYLWQENLWR